MVKSAGFLKKLKKIGNTIGKGASWINKNIIKPLNPIIDTALDFIPYGGVVKGVKNTVTKGLDFLDDVYQTQDNKRIQNYVTTGADILLDTQRSKQDQKYFNKFPVNKFIDYSDDGEYDRDFNEDDSYIEQPRKTYSNPFGKRLN